MSQGNRDTGAAHIFHNATKYVAVQDAAGEEHFMMGTPPELENPIWQEDWSLEPFPFKIYETLRPLAIPREFPSTTLPALEAIARTGRRATGRGTARSRRAGADRPAFERAAQPAAHLPSGAAIEFRTAGGTGARYHLELYFVCADLPDLAAGVYHYAAQRPHPAPVARRGLPRRARRRRPAASRPWPARRSFWP